MSDVRENVLMHRESVRSELAAAGVAWLDALRDEGAARFAELGLPKATDEDWRFTNLRRISRDFPLPGLVQNEASPSIDPIAGLDSFRLVFSDGGYNASASSAADLPTGVTVTSMRALLSSDPERLRGVLGAQINAELVASEDGLRALNTAFLNDGAVVLIDAGVQLETPIELVFATSATATESHLIRNVVVLGEGASATVIERYVGDGGAKALTHALSEVQLNANSRLEHARVQDAADVANHIGGTWVGVARDGHYHHTMAAIGGALTRHDLHVRLHESGAHCSLDGVVLGAGKRHVDNHTTIEHVAPHCTSHEHYRSVLDDRSRSVFHGRIRVHEGAQKTDAHQLNRSLLLSEDAQANAKPQLEIYADDVKCSHGATIGQLDQDSKFYLQSRGIDADTARALLTLAFAEEVLSDLKVEPLRQYLARAVIHRLVPEALIDESLINPAALGDAV